jgi:hypothetical protein
MSRPLTLARIASAHEPRAALDRAAVRAGACARAQQLVAEIAVARLHVDEAKSRVAGARGRADEIVDERIELGILEHADAVREAPIEDRVRARRDRRWPIVDVRPGIAARVRQLQADVQIAVRVRSEALAMRGDELLAQGGNRADGARRDQQLMRIRAAVVADGDGFPAPHQLRAARPEVTPAPMREVARLAVARAVPPFHRQDAEPVADANAVHIDRASKRRCRRRRELVVERERDAASLQVRAKRAGGSQRGDTRVRRAAHALIAFIPSPARRPRPGNDARDATLPGW